MILLLHISIALASIALATISYVWPTASKLRASYALIALTLVTGSALVVSAPAHMLHACISGIIYVVIVTAMVMVARRKLVTSL